MISGNKNLNETFSKILENIKNNTNEAVNKISKEYLTNTLNFDTITQAIKDTINETVNETGSNNMRDRLSKKATFLNGLIFDVEVVTNNIMEDILEVGKVYKATIDIDFNEYEGNRERDLLKNQKIGNLGIFLDGTLENYLCVSYSFDMENKKPHNRNIAFRFLDEQHVTDVLEMIVDNGYGYESTRELIADVKEKYGNINLDYLDRYVAIENGIDLDDGFVEAHLTLDGYDYYEKLKIRKLDLNDIIDNLESNQKHTSDFIVFKDYSKDDNIGETLYIKRSNINSIRFIEIGE